MSSTARGGGYSAHGAYYTEQQLADSIVFDLLPTWGMHLRAEDPALEPGGGGGAIVGSMLRAGCKRVHVLDVDPWAPVMRSPSPRFERRVQSFLHEEIWWDAPTKGKARANYEAWWAKHRPGQLVPERQLLQSAAPWPRGWPRPKLVIGNPPFGIRPDGCKSSVSVIVPHVRRALALSTHWVVLILPAGYLGSDARGRGIHQTHPPTYIAQLVPRPSFTGGGSDSNEYIVAGWDLSKIGDGRKASWEPWLWK